MILFWDDSCYKKINDRKATCPPFLLLREESTLWAQTQAQVSEIWEIHLTNATVKWKNGQVFTIGFKKEKSISKIQKAHVEVFRWLGFDSNLFPAFKVHI